MWLEENILADTLSYVHLEEATYDTPKEKLTAQVIWYTNAPASKSRLVKIKAEMESGLVG